MPLNIVFDHYKRIVKSGGPIVLFSQQPFSAALINANPDQFRYEWIWKKAQGTGHLNANRMPLKIHENILVFYDKLPTYHPQKTFGHKPYITTSGRQSENYGDQVETLTVNQDGSRYPVDVIEFPQVGNSQDDRLHPTQKPVPLLEYLINTYTNPGELVMDNCMGVGSTGVACVNTGRSFIGMENDEKYFRIAEERIAKVNKDGV